MATYSLPRGVAKTWVRFNGSGTVAIDDDENVDSITDHAVGQYTVNITQDYSAADYCFAFGARLASYNMYGTGDAGTASATGSHRIRAVDSSGIARDATEICVAYFGDLA